MLREPRGLWPVAVLLGAWLVVVTWQVSEHRRVVDTAKSDLRNRSREIASTLSAVTRAMRFRGAVFQERLDPVLNELANTRPSALVSASQLLAIGLLNNEGDTVAAAGETNLIARATGESERWTGAHVIFVLPVEGATVTPEGTTNNPTVVLPPFRTLTNNFSRTEPRTNVPAQPHTNAAGEMEAPAPPPDRPSERRDGRRPPWMRGMSEPDFKALAAKRELHGLVLVMSTENLRAVTSADWWQRCVIVFFAGVSVLGLGLAWRSLARSADLQIRLVRASELNSHLKELNLAAAGLAHETRNPLNIIRGQAQMLSRAAEATPDVQEKSRLIMHETDKVTAQLTEFINYSRPREVRRSRVAPAALAAEVIRTLNFDLEEKKLRAEVTGETFAVEADEQLLRQVLFNLLLNAVQAAEPGGSIQCQLRRTEKNEAALEVCDDGPGVPPENRAEIFKPYFTTHQKGTGLGLAVVQQIVHAHGWEIECQANEPRGARFRISHLKIVA